MSENVGVEWDIKFNHSQLATFGGNNPSDVEISINGLSVKKDKTTTKTQVRGPIFMRLTT